MLAQRTLHRNFIRLFGFAFILATTLPGWASSPDANKPTEITANQVEFDDQQGTAHYHGNVISKQGSRLLKSQSLTIYRGEDKQISMMHATGHPATFEAQPDPAKPKGTGKAKDIKYYPKEDKAVLTGDAELQQKGDIIRGPFLTYYFETGKLISPPNKKGRTTVIIQPKRGK